MRSSFALCCLVLTTACGMFDTSVQPVDPQTLPPLSGREQAILVGAESAARQGNFDVAERDYQSAIAASTGHVEAHLALAKLYAATSQPVKEREVLDRALALQPNNPGANYLLGKLELGAGNYQAATDAFDRGLVTVPDDLDLSNASGIAHDMMGDHAEAQAIYLRMINLHADENLTGVRTNLGMSYLFSNQPKQALAVLKPLLATAHPSSVTRHNVALAYGLMGKTAEARAVLKGEADEDTRVNELKRLKDHIAGKDSDKTPRLMKPMLHEQTY